MMRAKVPSASFPEQTPYAAADAAFAAAQAYLGAALFRRRASEVQEGLRAAWQELLDPAKAG